MSSISSIYSLGVLYGKRKNKQNRRVRLLREVDRRAGKKVFVEYRLGLGREFYLTREWANMRRLILGAFGARCMKCKKRGRASANVDHIKPRSKYPELELDASNMQVLCGKCNLEKFNTDETDYRGMAGQIKARALSRVPQHASGPLPSPSVGRRDQGTKPRTFVKYEGQPAKSDRSKPA